MGLCKILIGRVSEDFRLIEGGAGAQSSFGPDEEIPAE